MDNPNFYNNFPTNNYTFHYMPANIAQPTPSSTDYVPPASNVLQPINYVPHTSNFVPQFAALGTALVPPTPTGFVPTPSAVFAPSTLGLSAPNPNAPPPQLPQTSVPPPPLPPAFYMPHIVPNPIPNTTMEIPPQIHTDCSTDFAAHSAEYNKTHTAKPRKYPKKPGEYQKYTPNPIDQPQPKEYPKEYMSQFSTIRMLERLEYPLDNPTEEPEEEQCASEAPLDTGSFVSDKYFITNFEANILTKKTQKHCQPRKQTTKISIADVKEKICNLVLMVNVIKNKEKVLKEQLTTLSEGEWTSSMKQIEKTKAQITETMAQINDSYLDLVRKYLTKRAAKRLRQKRVRLERRREKEHRMQELKEKSRKIDENLQKIKDDILKTKLEEEANFQADIVLKEVLRKKNDAKKSISKLDALVRLRKARKNTAKGRGEKVSDMEEKTFNNNIEKLKTIWLNKLEIYNKEESDLRVQLKRETDKQSSLIRSKECQVIDNLVGWREALFGEGVSKPQVNFRGDVQMFIANRCQWDHFISSEGSPLPIGWVVPSLVTSDVVQESTA